MTIPRVPIEKAQALSPGQRQSLAHQTHAGTHARVVSAHISLRSRN
jgi:hypothetical protein